MDVRVLMAQRINSGQSEVWCEATPDKRRVLATNGIVFPVRTTCSVEECAAFYQELETGPATVPEAVTIKLLSDFGL